MKLHSSHIDNLRKLYIDQIQHLHSAESQIIEALPKMIEAADETELKRALQTHLQETREHVSRIEQILQETIHKLEAKKDKAMSAIISEGEDIIKDASNTPVRDAGIITAAQRVEHYEIAVYGSVRNFAQIMGETEQASLLQQTLDEEKHADEVLSSISTAANTRADKAA
jgi:ferritin-like metal-binding protein YciE